LQPAGGQNPTALEALRSENDRLKAQLSALQSAATVAALEKSALENKIKQLSAEVADLRAANDAGRIRTLTEQRDELAKQLASAGKKTSRKSADAQLAALNQELQSLRARVAVDEAKPVPYTPDELALFRQAAPPPNSEPIKRSIHELPSGTAELVTSAQQHFSRHEYDQAEADYQKILDRDQNNGLALANLATIELQQGKLEEAEKHIRAALAQSPDDAYNLATLGELEFRQEKYDAALDSLSQAAKIDPNNPEIQNYLGVTMSHKGLRVQAETALRKAIELNPLYAPAHNNLAVVYLNQTPPAPLLARWHYQKAIAAGQPRNPDLEKQLADKGAPVD
jgi:tetratricopeptide (TPR) repeat protein